MQPIPTIDLSLAANAVCDFQTDVVQPLLRDERLSWVGREALRRLNHELSCVLTELERAEGA